MLEPIASPTVRLGLFSKEDIAETSISGADDELICALEEHKKSDEQSQALVDHRTVVGVRFTVE